MKAVSPMIATILLIAAVVVVAGMVAGWGTTLFKGTTGTVKQQASNFTIQCAVGMLDIQKVYCTTDADGLVGYWKFDSVNASNYTMDTSGHGNHGKLINYPCNPATCNLTEGKYGSALKFDGVNDYVEIPRDLSGGLSGITLEAWVRGEQKANLFFAKNDAFIIRFRGEFHLKAEDGTGSGYLYWDPPLPLNEWVHLAATWSNPEVGDGKMKLYQNGVKQATEMAFSGGSTGKLASSSWFQIGSFYSPDYPTFKGVIDELRIYNRALSADEIKRHYEHGVAVRALVSNIGQTNLGKHFTLGWTVNNRFNSSLVNLTTDLTPGSIQWLNVYNITEAGPLQQVKVTSTLCPNVEIKKDISGIIC